MVNKVPPEKCASESERTQKRHFCEPPQGANCAQMRPSGYFTLFIHFRIGPVTLVSEVSGDMTSEMWL